jgi:hypothetical protein
VIAAAINLLAPITYLSQNWNFSVATRSTELPLVPWARLYARSLTAIEGPAPTRSVTLQWDTPPQVDRQFVELERMHTPPARISTEVPTSVGTSSLLPLHLPPGHHYQWRVITLHAGLRRTTDWSQLYLRE